MAQTRKKPASTSKAKAATKASKKATAAPAKTAAPASTQSKAETARPKPKEKAKFVYDFNEGGKEMKDLLGGKGANLAEMTNLGLPVPPGFTITTEACKAYLEDQAFPRGLLQEVDEHLRGLEQAMGRRLGDLENPLLVSVRSGAKYSMPGMMDTVLNLGLNDRSVVGLARRAGSDRFAFDSYRRFIQMFGKIVMDIPSDAF